MVKRARLALKRVSRGGSARAAKMLPSVSAPCVTGGITRALHLIATSALSAALFSPVAFGAEPLCFTGLTNSTPPGQGLATSVAEASTAQTLEALAQRRIEAARGCPEGFTLINGVCQRSRPAATSAAPAVTPVAATVQSPANQPVTASAPPKQKSTAVRSGERAGREQAGGSPVIEASTTVDVSAGPTFAAWFEGYADYQKRQGPTSATQHILGAVAGVERVFSRGSNSARFGFLAGGSTIKQSESSARRVSSFNITVDVDRFLNVDPPPTEFSVTGVDRDYIESLQRRLEGATLGLTGSLILGRFFIDGVAKIDAFDISQARHVYDSRGSFRGTFNFPFGTGSGNIPSFDINGAYIGDRANNCVVVFTTPFQALNLTQEQRKATIQQRLPTLFRPVSVFETFDTTLTSFVFSNASGYRFDLTRNWMLEPFVGTLVQYSSYGDNAARMGLKDGYALRLEGGARLGYFQVFDSGLNWSTSLKLSAYSDVVVDGFVVTAGGSTARTDEGKLRGRAALESRLQFPDGFSLFGEVSGRIGEDYWGIGGKIGSRIEW